MKRIGVSDAQKRICFCTFGFLKPLRWYWGTESPVKMPWTSCKNDSKNTFKYWSCFVVATHLPALREHFPHRALSTAAHWVRNSQCRPLSGVLRGHLRTLSPFCRRFCSVGTTFRWQRWAHLKGLLKIHSRASSTPRPFIMEMFFLLRKIMIQRIHHSTNQYLLEHLLRAGHGTECCFTHDVVIPIFQPRQMELRLNNLLEVK